MRQPQASRNLALRGHRMCDVPLVVPPGRPGCQFSSTFPSTQPAGAGRFSAGWRDLNFLFWGFGCFRTLAPARLVCWREHRAQGPRWSRPLLVLQSHMGTTPDSAWPIPHAQPKVCGPVGIPERKGGISLSRGTPCSDDKPSCQLFTTQRRFFCCAPLTLTPHGRECC